MRSQIILEISSSHGFLDQQCCVLRYLKYRGLRKWDLYVLTFLRKKNLGRNRKI